MSTMDKAASNTENTQETLSTPEETSSNGGDPQDSDDDVFEEASEHLSDMSFSECVKGDLVDFGAPNQANLVTPDVKAALVKVGLTSTPLQPSKLAQIVTRPPPGLPVPGPCPLEGLDPLHHLKKSIGKIKLSKGDFEILVIRMKWSILRVLQLEGKLQEFVFSESQPGGIRAIRVKAVAKSGTTLGQNRSNCRFTNRDFEDYLIWKQYWRGGVVDPEKDIEDDFFLKLEASHEDGSEEEVMGIIPRQIITMVYRMFQDIHTNFQIKLMMLRDIRDDMKRTLVNSDLGIFRELVMVKLEPTTSLNQDTFYVKVWKRTHDLLGILRNMSILLEETSDALQFIKIKLGCDTKEEKDSFPNAYPEVQKMREFIGKTYNEIGQRIVHLLANADTRPIFLLVICFLKLARWMRLIEEALVAYMKEFKKYIDKEKNAPPKKINIIQ